MAAGDQVHADAASAGLAQIAPSACPIPDAYTAHANDRGSADANQVGPVICATRSSPIATSIPVSAGIMLLASA